ncbi:MAG: S9 family peptidase [Firmicutes bacterium]|nr:S9 family peptidase [Bacillota bacterium]
MKPIVYEDLYQFRFVSDLKMSPDGKHGVFTVTWADEDKNGYKSGLWLLDVESGDYFPLTAGEDEKGAIWLDNDNIVFATGRDKEKGVKKGQWYQINIHGGEAKLYLEIEGAAGGLKKMSENRWLYTESVQPEVEEDFWVFDELPFWFNGQGVTNGKRSELKIYDMKAKASTTVTQAPFDVDGYTMSPGGYNGAWCGSMIKDVAGHGNELYVNGQKCQLNLAETAEIGSLCFIDDHQLFFTAQTYEWPGRSPRYYVYNIVEKSLRELPYMDGAASSTVGSDATYGAGEKLAARGGWLYFLNTHWNHARLMRMCIEDGKVDILCDKPGQISSFGLAGDYIYMTAMRDMKLTEVYRLNLITGEETQVTELNSPYHQEHELSIPEYFTFKNRAGVELEGFVLKPAGYEPGKKYPGILEMHGGPKVVFGAVFHHEMQCFASQGYFVFYTNPRGSDGRGEEFANVTENLGKIDYEDFMDFTDEVIKRYPDLDEKHIGICGGSYGGFMCNWMIGHTDRYAAAASQRSISNYLTKSLCTDIGFNHNMAQLGTDPWQGFDTVWATSPLKYAPNAVTPTLFIQSDEDYRCWMSDAVQMFNALQMNGTPARMTLFHGENHELSRGGKPKNRLRRLKEIGDWFEKYLKK